jgi:spermidine synthase
MVSVFLVSLSGLTLQIALTRIFSVAIWYHYAFVVVSIALFGWGLGGIILHFLRPKQSENEFGLVAMLMLLFAISMPVCLFAILRFPAALSSMPLYYLTSLVPFFLAGICLAFLYSRFAESSSKLYFADLAGASVACLAAEPILSTFGPESAILMLGILASILSVLLSAFSRKRKLIAISLIGLVITSTILVGNVRYSFIDYSYSNPAKSMFWSLQDDHNLKIVSTKWNSFSRIDVVEGYPGILGMIFIDAEAATAVFPWDGLDIGDLQYLKSSYGDGMEFIPYSLVENPETLIIGPGGGQDVLVALAGGSKKVVAVELNPLIVENVQNYGEKVGNIYSTYPSVEVLIDEGRSFMSRSDQKFDVITLIMVDSFAALSAGGYSLAENYLYTKEAFVDYLSHLSEQGILVMLRWEPEVPRLFSTAVEAFSALGENITDIGKHIAVIRNEVGPGVVKDLVILKRTPFSEADAEKIKNQVATPSSSHSLYYAPYIEDGLEPYHSLFNGSITTQQFYASFPGRVDAVSDDSPFYFNFERGVPKALNDLIVLTSLLALSFVVVPWTFSYWKRRRVLKTDTPSSSTLYLFILFFAALGIGYMLLEMALMQKFILFLGYPTRALSVILFSLLLSGGIGSFVSGHAIHGHQDSIRNILLACPLTILLATVYIFCLPGFFASLLAQSSMIRIVTAVLLLFPLGFFMGIPFPSGLYFLKKESDQNVPWMWGINGATSVCGSILATVVGIMWGFHYAMALGVVTYSVAFLCAWRWRRNLNQYR